MRTKRLIWWCGAAEHFLQFCLKNMILNPWSHLLLIHLLGGAHFTALVFWLFSYNMLKLCRSVREQNNLFCTKIIQKIGDFNYSSAFCSILRALNFTPKTLGKICKTSSPYLNFLAYVLQFSRYHYSKLKIFPFKYFSIDILSDSRKKIFLQITPI